MRCVLEPVAHIPPVAATVKATQAKLDRLLKSQEHPDAEMTWGEMASTLSQCPEVDWIRASQKFHYAPAAMEANELAHMLLFRKPLTDCVTHQPLDCGSIDAPCRTHTWTHAAPPRRAAYSALC